MHNPESVFENETLKLLRDFEMQTDPLISARWPDPLIINKKNRIFQIVDFAILTVPQSKSEAINHVIDHFVSITTLPTSAVLLRLIYSSFDMVGSYGVVLSCY